MHEQARHWPLAGLGYFLAHPGLWLRPILGSIAALVVLALLFGLVCWWFWPTAADFWPWLWGVVQAIGAGLLGVLLGWFLLMPVIMGFAFESLVGSVLKRHGAERRDESVVRALLSTGSVLLRTLHWRLLYPCLGLICWFVFPPLSPIVSHLGIAHVAGIDGCDLALALRGVKGRERVRLIAGHRGNLFLGSLLATGVGIALGITLIGWILFLPMMFTGTAIWVACWRVPSDEQVAGAPAA